MDKIPIEDLYSIFPNVEKDVIDILYSQYNNNIIDTLLEISDSSDIKNNKNNQGLKEDQNNMSESDSSEEDDKKNNKSLINNLLNSIKFTNQKNYKYQKL